MLLILSLVFSLIRKESASGDFRSENLFISTSDISWRDT